MKNISGIFITSNSVFSNNFGENDGNINMLQKIVDNNEEYIIVSADAIRFALRERFADPNVFGETNLNRTYDNFVQSIVWKDPAFSKWCQDKSKINKQDIKIDDDVLGFLGSGGAKKGMSGRKSQLVFSPALSLNSYSGDMQFSAQSSNASPNAAKENAKKNGNTKTIYQKERTLNRFHFYMQMNTNNIILNTNQNIEKIIYSIMTLGNVGGNQARNCNSFSPTTAILRVSNHFEFGISSKEVFNSTGQNGEFEIDRLLNYIVNNNKQSEYFIFTQDNLNLSAFEEKGIFVCKDNKEVFCKKIVSVL